MPCLSPKEGAPFWLAQPDGHTFTCFLQEEGCYFVFLIKGPVGASVAMRQCSKAAQTVIMSIIKGAESLLVAVTSPRRELSVFVLTLALRRG